MATTQMSRDLIMQAESYLAESFEETIAETDRQKVVQWLCKKIEEERHGWKQKLQLAFKEVEKERKLALSVHETVHRLNSNFENYNIPVYMVREPSMYHGSDKDSRITNVDRLEKNINALVESLNCSQEERIECFQYLQFKDESCHLADVLKGKMSKLVDQNNRYETDETQTEQRLTKEIKTLQETLDMQIKLNSEENDRHEKEVSEMRKFIEKLRSKVNLALPYTRSSKGVNKGCQANLRKPTRECCLQVTMDLENSTGHQQYNGISFSTDVDILDMRPQESFDEQPIKAVTIVRHRENNKENYFPEKKLEKSTTFNAFDVEKSKSLLSLHSANSIPGFRDDNKRLRLNVNGHDTNPIKPLKYKFAKKPSQGGHFGVSNAGYKTEYLGSIKSIDPEMLSQEDKSEQLRGQVVGLANKLDKAKLKAEHYQQQLALMKAENVENGYIKEEGKKGQYTSRSIHDFRPEELQGFLSGIKVKDIEKELIQDTLSKQPTDMSHKLTRPSKALMAYNGTAKCLRCNNLYKLKDNCKTACRYHPKNKNKIEKYDSCGKLKKVFYFWECCMQSSEVIGCRSGEHM